MPYGSIKVDNIIYTKGGADTTITVSGIVDSLSGSISVTGAISGSSVSAATGTFTTLSGSTTAGTTATFVTGVFTTSLSGAAITGDAAGFTSVTGTTVTGTTANFVSGVFTTSISGVTVTGTTASFTSGVFTTLTGTTVNVVSGIFASGTAAAPSVAVGTTGNGLYSTAANEIAIATSGAGSRLTVDASGNVNIDAGTFYVDAVNNRVGVGTTGPQAPFQVLDRVKISDSTQAQGSLVLGDGASTAFNVGFARWNGSTNAPGAGGLGFFSQGSANSGGHYFYTGDAAAGSTTERVRIAPDGTFRVRGSTSNTPSVNDAVQFNGSAPANSVILDASGNLGLGVVPSAWSASYKVLDISSAAAFTAAGSDILVVSNATLGLTNQWSYKTTGAASFSRQTGGAHQWFTAPSGTAGTASTFTQAMTLDASGKLGIGTSSPSYPLHVVTSGNSGLAVYAGTSGANQIYLGNTGGESVVGTLTNQNLGIITNGGQKVTVTTGGNVGIGTTSPQKELQINATTPTIRLEESSGSAKRLELSISSSAEALISAPQSASSLSFGTNGSTRATIDSSGRLLVGTSSARNVFDNAYAPRLQVEGTDATHALSVVINAASTDGSYLFLGKSRGASAGSTTVVQSGDRVGAVVFQGADGSQLVRAAQIEAFVDATPGANDMPGRLVFSTTADGESSPTPRMKIQSTGITSVFSSSNGFYSIVSAAAGTTIPTFSGRRSGTSTSDGTDTFIVYSNGNVVNTNGSYTTISDAKLKENIVDAGSQWNDLKAIQIRNWNFKEETGHETHRQIGPIAQELEVVCPGLVFETPDRDEDGNETGEVTKGVNQSVLYMKAVKALQEAMERIEQLEAKVAALEAQ